MGRSHREVEEEAMRDPQFKAEYEALEAEFQKKKEEIIKKMIKGYQEMAEENKRFAEETLPLAGEVLPPFEQWGLGRRWMTARKRSYSCS